LRDAHPDIQALGADVVAIGTGNQRHAKEFIEEEDIPFAVLVDDDAEAAHAASVRKETPWGLFRPSTYAGSRRARREGHRIHAPGKRVTQLGATFVVGPGDRVVYEHVDANTTDHAPIPDVLAALRS
jgi:peroxiredoxin